MEHSNSDIISLHVYNNSPYQITLPLGLLGYFETSAHFAHKRSSISSQ